jgi:hypothetical protein
VLIKCVLLGLSVVIAKRFSNKKAKYITKCKIFKTLFSIPYSLLPTPTRQSKQ